MHCMGSYASSWGFLDDPSGKESASQCRQCKTCGFDPWVEKILWKRKWQPTPVFLQGESHGQRSLVGYSPRGHKESDMTEVSSHTYALYTHLALFKTAQLEQWVGLNTDMRV